MGLYLASLLEKQLDVLVLDRNQALGKKADSGLYSANLSGFIPIEKGWVEHEVTGARLHSPGGKVLELNKPSTAAYVVDRERFTKWLAGRVKSRIVLGARVTCLEIGDTVKVTTTRGTFESKLLVGCDGASSIVRKHFSAKPKEIINGIIALKSEKNNDTQLDIHFDKNIIQDGFFWKIPRGKSTEYGALGKNVRYSDLENFFKIADYEKTAAFMNLGLFPTAFPRTILVGEAAGHVKPWSGGGIIFGFTCSQIARDVIFEAFQKGDFSEGFLKSYDELWKKKIGGTIKLGLHLRDFFIKMDNQILESYFTKFKKLPFLDRMDMDFPKLELLG